MTIKVPRWDLLKFKGVDRKLGSTMKSVGEIMSIGRTFPDTSSFENGDRAGSRPIKWMCLIVATKSSKRTCRPIDIRLYATIEAFRRGHSLDEVFDLTRLINGSCSM